MKTLVKTLMRYSPACVFLAWAIAASSNGSTLDAPSAPWLFAVALAIGLHTWAIVERHHHD